jgi:hypothetical protein
MSVSRPLKNIQAGIFGTKYVQHLATLNQGCQIFLGRYNIPKRGKMYQKRPQNIPNDHKIYQMAVK